MEQKEIKEALRSLILGLGVRRGSHDLRVEGEDTTAVFTELLQEEGFLPVILDEVKVQPGERVPAFLVEGFTAHFGWIFWEKFFPKRMRKIYGSVNHNEKGDWSIILGRGSKHKVYANPLLKESMDLEFPSSF